MELPSLPTDSLYKFVALAGLALMLFAATYPQAKMLELQVAVADAEALSEKLDANLDNTEKKLARLEGIQNPHAAALEVVSELNLKNRLDKAEVRRASTIVKAQLKAMQYYLGLSIISLVVGTLMTIAGFGLWYVRIQKPLDRAIAKGRAS
jgi:hypothetical protein